MCSTFCGNVYLYKLAVTAVTPAAKDSHGSMDDSVNRLVSSAGSSSPIAEEDSCDACENSGDDESTKGGKPNTRKRVARKVADKPVKAKKEPTKRAPRKTSTTSKAKKASEKVESEDMEVETTPDEHDPINSQKDENLTLFKDFKSPFIFENKI